MLIPISHLEKIFNSGVKQLKLDLSDKSSANAFQISGDQINFRHVLDPAYLAELKARDLQHVSVVVDQVLLGLLRRHFPSDYAQGEFAETLDELTVRLTALEEINKNSKRQRSLILMEEVADAQSRLLYRRGSSLSAQFVSSLKGKVPATRKFQFNASESGILVFVDHPAKNIGLKIDILAVFAKTTMPVYMAETVEEAFTLFTTKHPVLLLLTNLDSSSETKDLFLRCVVHDPFLKYINYSRSPSAAREAELEKIMATYQGGYASALAYFKSARAEAKPGLEAKLRNPIMDRLEQLRQKPSRDHYIEMKYYLFKLGLKFNVRTLEIILDKIKIDPDAP